jgi:hypothetical protein
MAHKDTLTLYEELIATGVPDGQAKIQAHQMGALSEQMGGIDKTLKQIEKDLMWMRVIGAAMVVSFMSNIFWLAR